MLKSKRVLKLRQKKIGKTNYDFRIFIKNLKLSMR